VDRNSFFFRPTELLGIALGASSVEEGWQGPGWLQNTLARGEHLISPDPWSQAMSAWAARALETDLPSLHPPSDDLSVAALAVAEGRNDVDIGLFLEGAAVSAYPRDLARAAALWAALQATVGTAARAFAVATARDAVDLVTQLCRRFPAFAARLARRHDNRAALRIEDEYDVQDALHAILLLHFADVRDEEPSPSHAAIGTRLDLLLKQERVVVETKMTRASLTQRKLLEEIAVDKERYRAHPDCGAVIFFVYDPDGRLRNPVALERDVSETVGETQFVVVVAPSEHGAGALA